MERYPPDILVRLRDVVTELKHDTETFNMQMALQQTCRHDLLTWVVIFLFTMFGSFSQETWEVIKNIYNGIIIIYMVLIVITAAHCLWMGLKLKKYPDRIKTLTTPIDKKNTLTPDQSN